jgi:hypothetical protein
MPVIGNRADLDVCQSVLVVQQPRLDRGGTHGVCVAVKASAFEVSQYSRPFDEKINSLRSLVIVINAKRRE